MKSNNGDSVAASGRAWLYILILVIFLVALLLLLVERLDEMRLPENPGQREIDIAVDKFRQLIDDLLIGTVIFSLLISAYLFRLARKITETAMFPPPGTLVLAKTRILRGDSARRMATRLYILAAIVWSSVLIPVYLEWLLDAMVTKT